ncbi:MAG: DUF4878 domain-containing protein [Prevotellaceae bacterium]|jgi:hypothetical protein|nr:DUF4878 domain-containing protein [Prevotellaceae bacterium]
MKLLKSLVLVVAAGLMITACGGASTPSDVVKKMNEATLNFDFKEAAKYVAKEHVESYNKLAEQFAAPEAKDYIEGIKAMVKDAKFEILEEKIAEDGNTAVVKVKSSGMGQEKEEEVNLVKEDGQWKVNEGLDMGGK